MDMDLPFDGAISRYFREGAPKAVRTAIEKADKDDILNPDYPYREEMGLGHGIPPHAARQGVPQHRSLYAAAA